MGVAFDAFDVVAVANYRPIPHDFLPLADYMFESSNTMNNANANASKRLFCFARGP